MKNIYEELDMLNKNWDERRLSYSSTILAIYTPVTSGLLLLSFNVDLKSQVQETLYIILSVTSALIVFSILLERLGYVLISGHIFRQFVEHINRGEYPKKQLSGKKWHSKLVTSQTLIVLILLVFNIFSALGLIIYNITKV